MSNYGKEYNKKIKDIIDAIEKEQSENICLAASLIYEKIKKGNVLQVFATGHSHMFSEELFYRAGGLVTINPIFIPFLMQHEGAISSTKYERLPGVSKIIYEGQNIKKDDPFIIVSNSGINAVPIEMARIVTKKKHSLIIITSMQTSSISSSRDSLNKHLYEYGDIVIDNCVPYGDGVIDTTYGKIAPSSTIACSYIAQRLVIEIINCYIKEGITPPIYMSANIPNGDTHNQKIYEEYKNKIKSLY